MSVQKVTSAERWACDDCGASYEVTGPHNVPSPCGRRAIPTSAIPEAMPGSVDVDAAMAVVFGPLPADSVPAAEGSAWDYDRMANSFHAYLAAAAR